MTVICNVLEKIYALGLYFSSFAILPLANGRVKMFSDYGSKVINRKHGEMFNSFYYSSIA
jgi:hypothetical protein